MKYIHCAVAARIAVRSLDVFVSDFSFLFRVSFSFFLFKIISGILCFIGIFVLREKFVSIETHTTVMAAQNGPDWSEYATTK